MVVVAVPLVQEPARVWLWSRVPRAHPHRAGARSLRLTLQVLEVVCARGVWWPSSVCTKATQVARRPTTHPTHGWLGSIPRPSF